MSTRLAAVAAALALGVAGCGDEDTETGAAQAPTTEEASPATTTDAEATPGEATPAEAGGSGNAEQAVDEALGRIDGVDQTTADSVREAARAFDAESERAGGVADEGVQRARGGLERAVQDADPRTREQLENALADVEGLRPGSAEEAVNEALSQANIDQATADRVREAARAADAQSDQAGGAAGDGAQRARDAIDRAVQDADPRTRKQLEDALGQIQDNLTTQGNSGG